MKRKTIEANVGKIAEPIADELGFDLVDIEFIKEGSQYFLRVYIDKTGGIGLDDCQEMSQSLSQVLDKEDPIEASYYLEVSSPGLDRPLKTDRDLERNLNKEVEVKLYESIDGKKILEGVLENFSQESISIRIHKDTVKDISRSKISLIRLVVKF